MAVFGFRHVCYRTLPAGALGEAEELGKLPPVVLPVIERVTNKAARLWISAMVDRSSRWAKPGAGRTSLGPSAKPVYVFFTPASRRTLCAQYRFWTQRQPGLARVCGVRPANRASTNT